MSGLRFAYLLALAVWLGGLIVLGVVVAPALFEALPATAPASGRVLAGTAFGAVLERFHVATSACAALMLGALLVMAVIGPRPRPFAPRVALIGVMLASGVVVARPIAGRIEALQASVAGPIAALPDHDPRKIAFGRLHGLSNVLLLVNVLGGLTLLFWEARDRRS